MRKIIRLLGGDHLIPKMQDVKVLQWQKDREAFERLKKLMGKLTNEPVKDASRETMQKIQRRWPQFIKEDDIP